MTTFPGTDGNDTYFGSDQADTMYGLNGDDQLNGGGGNDTLDGGPGNDLITGGTGLDTLTGGTGADIFRDTAAGLNGDTITDFSPGDRIQITDLALQNAGIDISGSAIIYNGGSINIGNGIAAGRLVVRGLGTTGVEIRLQAGAHNDFNGDGRSDVLWRSDDGTMRDWLGQPDGSFVGNIAHFNYNPGLQWHAVGTGDFNGDGRVDILWQNDDSTVREWLGQPDGSFVGNIAHVDVYPGPQWHVVGTGDFNGDGRADVLWRNDDGTMRDWLGQADGSFVGNIAHFNYNPGLQWHVVGTGDFNGDGRTDILWQNDDGTMRDWLGQPDGSFVGNIAHFDYNPGLQWHVVGTGDFNGDGFDDVLWRNDDGTMRDWLGQPDGSFVGNIAHFDANPGSDWHVADIGDYNGDAIDDLLLQNANGHVTEWLGRTDGSFVANPSADVYPDTQWHVQNPFVHDPFA
jgi:hypothetical protein